MTNRNLIIVLSIIVLVGLAGLYLYERQQGNSWVSETDTSTTTALAATSTPVASTTVTSGNTAPKTVSEVVSHGGNYTCTIESYTEGQHTTGNVYSAGGKTRLDFTVAFSNGNTVVTHVIRTGTTSYTWIDGQPAGFKMAITPQSPVVAQPSGGTMSMSDINNISTDCHPWAPDVTKFSTPTGITFIAR